MPRFRDNPPPAAISDGVYAAKILTAKTGISPRDNEWLTMRLELYPSRERISSTLTFVPAADLLITCFCTSTQLVRPAKGAEYDITPADVIGRYLYVVVSSEAEPDTGDLIPRITRFIAREDAIRRNPAIAQIPIQQAPKTLAPAI